VLNIDSIENGVVIDHISAGRGMDIYNYLNLEHLDCSVAIIKNAKSRKMGKKDIIKIENNIDLDFDILGFVDPGITVNIINDGVRVEKKRPALPDKIINIKKCKNPRCITSVETDIDQLFYLADTETRTYRCAYCEHQ